MNALGDFCVPILGISALVCAAAVFLYFSCIRKSHVRSTFNAEDTESASLPERYPQFFRDPHLLDDSPDPVDEPVTNIPETAPPPPVEKPHMLPPEPPENVFALKPPSAATQAAHGQHQTAVGYFTHGPRSFGSLRYVPTGHRLGDKIMMVWA